MTRQPFTFRGTELSHFDHAYNSASANLRSIEVPIIRRYLADKRRRILEIGNVLSHYQTTTWPVIDIQEQGERVRNIDIMSFQPKEPYDLIVSISTLEHIGQGKYAKHTAAVSLGNIVKRIKGMLAPGGVFVATVPIGYNEMVDRAIRNDATGADHIWYVRRADGNEWEQCTKEDALETPPTRWANAGAILQCGWFAWDVLNLGAGNKIIKYAVNHDQIMHRPEIDVTADLNYIWPWVRDSFDKVIALSVFEHLHRTLYSSMDQVWGILRPGGICQLKLPYWKSENAHNDATHRWAGFGLGVLDHLDPATKSGREYGYYTDRKWRIIKRPTLNRSATSFAATLRVRK
jgi:SAM-dependent methyltransferase